MSPALRGFKVQSVKTTTGTVRLFTTMPGAQNIEWDFRYCNACTFD